MRSAGCIINDIVDRNIDLKIKRTASRPITSSKVKLFEAFVILIIFLILSLLILMQFSLQSILISLLSFPFIIFVSFYEKNYTLASVFIGYNI